MRGIYAVAGAAVLGAALIGWVALAWAQPALSKLPAADGPPPEGSAPSGSASPSVAPSPSMPAPAAGGPSVAPPGSGPAALPPGAYRGLRPSGGEPAPASPGQPAPAAAGDPAPLGAGSAVSAPGSHGDDAQPTVTNDNTTGRQEPAVSLEWIGPPVAKMGQPADYTVVVRNACNIPVQQVMVRIRVPQGMQVGLTEPKAVSEGNVLMWELGTLMPR